MVCAALTQAWAAAARRRQFVRHDHRDQLTIYAAAPAGTTASRRHPRRRTSGASSSSSRQAPRSGSSRSSSRPWTRARSRTTLAPRSRTRARSPISASSPLATPPTRSGSRTPQDLLQVSPTDTALELTQPTAAVPGSPKTTTSPRSTYGYTFARVVPNSAQEAKAPRSQEMHGAGGSRSCTSPMTGTLRRRDRAGGQAGRGQHDHRRAGPPTPRSSRRREPTRCSSARPRQRIGGRAAVR